MIPFLTDNGIKTKGKKQVERPKVLLVDDDINLLNVMRIRLNLLGFDVTVCNNPEDAIRVFDNNEFVLAITDQRMEGVSGIELMSKLHQKDPFLPVIIMTAYASVEDAVESVHKGAYTYLQKPIAPEELEACINKALEKRKLETKLERERKIWVNVIESIGAGIILINANKTIAWFNNKIKELLNTEELNNVQESPCFKIFAPKGLPCMQCPTQQAFKTKDVYSMEYYDKERERWLLVTSTPVIDSKGEMVQAVELVIDITTHKKGIMALLNQERLKGALEMAGAAAHELNQPMQAILGWGELLRKKMDPDNPYSQILDLICKQIERLGEITSKISDVTRYVKMDYPGTEGILDLKKALKDKNNK